MFRHVPRLVSGVSLRQSMGLTVFRRGNADQTSASPLDSIKVTVCGAAGAVGQPLAMMLKQSSCIHKLSLYGKQGVKGVGLDVSHIDTSCQVCSYEGKEDLDAALQGANIVMLLSGEPQEETCNSFKVNASYAHEIAEACTRVCPQALIAVVSNPVNSLVPVVCEVFKKAGIDADKRVFGVTCLDVVRANTFAAEVLGSGADKVSVPVVGGHAGKTIVPLLSKTRPNNDFSPEEVKLLTEAVQEAGPIVTKAKGGRGVASLSTAFAAARFALTLVKGLHGAHAVIECAYVRSDVVTDVRYFASPLVLGPGGVDSNLGLPSNMSDFECALLAAALPDLIKDIEVGESFVPEPELKSQAGQPGRGPRCPPETTSSPKL